MKTTWTKVLVGVAVFLCGGSPAFALTVPFEEDFDTGTANWKDSASADPTWVAIGGSDGGGYISTAFAFSSSASDTPVLFRGHDSFDASGDAFVGDWIAGDVTKLRAYVRHDVPQPLNFFTRFASSFGFPGAVAIDFVPVPPGAWTEIEINTVPSSPQFVTFEGTDFQSVFSAIGNVQIGASRPASLASDPTLYTFELDQVSIVPEPATGLLATLTTAIGLMIRRYGTTR